MQNSFSKANFLLLTKFLRGADPAHFNDDTHWDSVLGVKTCDAINSMISRGLLVTSTLDELLTTKFNVAQLKDALNSVQLKTTGKKSDLVTRLIADAPLKARELAGDLVILKCSPEGALVGQKFLHEQAALLEAAEDKVKNHLIERRFEDAAKTVREFESQQVFQRGVGISWNDYSSSSEIEDLRVIFGRKPKLLGSVNSAQLEAVQFAAGMMLLWGSGRATKWLPTEFSLDSHLDGEAACRMMIFHATFVRNMRKYAEMGIKEVTVLGVDDPQSCDECIKLFNVQFAINDVPELPLAACTCSIGCRLHASARFNW